MAPPYPQSHFFLLCFFALMLHVQSTHNLLPSDHQALLLILKDLGIHSTPPTNLCDSPGIFCDRVNSSFVLRVTRIVFLSQHLQGALSPAIGDLSELKQLSLADNLISGQIPPQIAACQKLELLNLGNNLLDGEIPPGFSSLIRLRFLDLSSNKLSGKLVVLKYFPDLEKLNLADNMFVGTVPVSLRNLRFINISGNSLLEGPVPLMIDQGQSLSSEKESIPKRYVFAERNTSHSAIAPLPAHKKRKNKKKKVVEWILGFSAGILAGCVSGMIFSMIFKLLMRMIRKGSNDTSLKIFSPIIKKPEDLAFLEKDDGLAALEVIGRGGCGEVYKASLPGSNGKEIAVKKIIQPSLDGEELSEEDSKLLTKKMRQVRSEIQTMGRIRHRNLLPLLAHLPRAQCHYLVYEYMKNGSLQDYLKKVSEGAYELYWLARFKIALGVAAGLEYLHMNQSPRIIHRDLKPANILLDDEMEARIADFGLAKALPDTNTHVTTSNVAGTVGYIAPEYYQTFKFTDKCDMYSFGVVLAVLVSGMFPSDEFFQHTDEMSLVKWIKNVMTSGDPTQAIDRKLLGSGYEEQMLLVLKVACFCTLDNPKERPNSKDARCMLSQIKH